MSSVNPDLTAEARIRDVALDMFPEQGFAGTTVRAVANAAGVSPGLVIHHYGSKEGLRSACDRHVVAQIRELKEGAIREGKLDDSATMAGAFQIAGPLMKYLGWSLSDGSRAASELFEEMARESARLFRLGEEAGAIEPSADPLARSAVLLSFQLGSLLLSDHVADVLGVDPLSMEAVMRTSRASMEIFSGAIFAPGQAESIIAALDEAIANTRKENSDD